MRYTLLLPFIMLICLASVRGQDTAEKKDDPKPQAKPVEVKSTGLSPVEVERLYESGVDLYAQGKLTEAAAAFKRIIESEPNNSSARRALDRVQSEIMQGGAKP